VKRVLLALAVGAAAILLGRWAAGSGLDEWAGARARALVAAVALAWVWHVRSRRRAGRPLSTTTAHGVLGGVALAAWAAWFDFGALPETGGVHRHDVFHYYVGAKYHRELGYGLLYRCAALAEAEDGREAEVRQRQMRDLRTLRLVPAADALADPAACRARFTDDRWRSFRDDVRRLRVSMPEAMWKATQIDHGYNPSPAWGATTGALAKVVPSTDAGLRFLASLDVVLLAACVVALHFAFGFRVAALALILWGTQEPAKFMWVGFAMLRLDWLAQVIAALALLRRGRPALAGAALGWAAATRIFPAIGLAGVLLAGLASPALRARFARPRRRFALGFGAALAASIALGSLAAGPASWVEFAGHIRRHTAGASSNDVGLGVIVAFDRDNRAEAVQERAGGSEGDAWRAGWAAEVQRLRAARRLPLRALQLAFAALTLTALVRLRRPWLGLALALLAVPAVTDLSNYYLALFIVAPVLTAARGALERWLLGFAALVQVLMVMPAVAWFADDRHLALSLAYVGAAAAIGWVLGRRPGKAGASA
jgi:hypothetical protein